MLAGVEIIEFFLSAGICDFSWFVYRVPRVFLVSRCFAGCFSCERMIFIDNRGCDVRGRVFLHQQGQETSLSCLTRSTDSIVLVFILLDSRNSHNIIVCRFACKNSYPQTPSALWCPPRQTTKAMKRSCLVLLSVSPSLLLFHLLLCGPTAASAPPSPDPTPDSMQRPIDSTTPPPSFPPSPTEHIDLFRNLTDEDPEDVWGNFATWLVDHCGMNSTDVEENVFVANFTRHVGAPAQPHKVRGYFFYSSLDEVEKMISVPQFGNSLGVWVWGSRGRSKCMRCGCCGDIDVANRT